MKTLDGIVRVKTKIQKAPLKKKIAWAAIVSLLVSSFVFALPVSIDAAPSAIGLVGYWNMDEGSGTVANDSTVNNNDGALIGGTGWTPSTVVFGSTNATTYNGVDSYIQVPDAAAVDLTGAFTLSAWVKTSDPSVQIAIRKTFAYEMFVYNGHLGVLMGSGATWSGADIIEGAIDIADGAWHNVATTYDDTTNTVNLYVDGVLDISSVVYPVSVGANAYDLYMGAWNDGTGSGFYLDGALDEVRLYDRVLSLSEIIDLYDTFDTTAPIVSGVTVSPNPALEGENATLTANVDDTTTEGSNIASAEYSLDSGAWTAMLASDSAFDEVSEDVTAMLTSLTAGLHSACVRGTDFASNTSYGTTCAEFSVAEKVVNGGGSLYDKKGKKEWTFGSDIYMNMDGALLGHITIVNHPLKISCNLDTISGLAISGGTAMFTASGTCNDGVTRTGDFIIIDNGEPGINDRIGVIWTAAGVPVLPNIDLTVIGGGNFQVNAPSFTFTASDSLYYNGPTDAAPLYGTGPISFTWDPSTGNVTGGYYNEVVPPTTGTTYYNVVTAGTVIGSVVNLTFLRSLPGPYGPFTFTGTLVGGVLTGQLDGPYYFTATGTVTP